MLVSKDSRVWRLALPLVALIITTIIVTTNYSISRTTCVISFNYCLNKWLAVHTQV